MKRTALLAVFLTLVSASVFAASGPFTTKIAFSTERDGNSEIYTVSPSGASATRLTNNPATDTFPAFSADGQKIAFTSNRDGNNEIYVMNANGTDQLRITFNAASDSQPSWSPDGKRIVFQSTRSGSFDIFSMNDDGTGVVQLTNDPGFDTDPSVAAFGGKIAFVSTRDGNNEIYVMDADGSNETRLTNNTLFEVRPDFSRNGGRIVFARNVPDGGGSTQQVVIMDADGTGEKVLTSAGANGNPAFAPDGNRIFFNSSRDLNTELYSMAVDGTNEVRVTNSLFSDANPSVQGLFEVETAAVYRPTLGKWVLRTENASPAIDLSVNFGGQPGDLPVSGNWNGDSRTDIGVFRNGTFHLALLKSGLAGLTIVEELAPITFGQAGDLPIAGDWDGDGKDDVGVFRPGTVGKFLLRQPRRVFAPFQVTIITTISFDFGQTGDLPVAGDWDGDGVETPGVYRPTEPGEFLLTNSFANVIDIDFIFGSENDRPLAGDWLGAGKDGVGVFQPGIQAMILTPDLSKGLLSFPFGQPGDLPVGGSWLP